MKQPLGLHTGQIAPLDRANVDTDLIIPKQFLKSVKRTGFGPNLFDQLRYLDEGQPGMDSSQRPKNPDFVLNDPRYRDATILLTRDNFGCGSSREHAPWALLDYGFRVLLAPSYADIFYNNCIKNGILPIVLQPHFIDVLFEEVTGVGQYVVTVDLEKQHVLTPTLKKIVFSIDASPKNQLLSGVDDIGITLQSADRIRRYEQRMKTLRQWMFEDL